MISADLRFEKHTSLMTRDEPVSLTIKGVYAIK
jgi:hypothetical protein